MCQVVCKALHTLWWTSQPSLNLQSKKTDVKEVNPAAIVWMCPPKFLGWNLTRKVMTFRSWAFWNMLDYEGEALVNGLTETGLSELGLWNGPKSSFTPFTTWGHSQKFSIYEPESGPSADTKNAGALILDFPACRTMRNTFLLFVRNLV